LKGLGGPLPGISSFISEHQVAAALALQGNLKTVE